MNDQQIKTEYVKSKYDRISRFYDLYEIPMEFLFFRRWRRLAISKLKRGDILEIGVGTGKNLPYYSAEFNVIATDISEKMLAEARERVIKSAAAIELRQMDAQKLELPDDTFDSSLATFVFCSVPDPITGLKELRRVLKNDGRAVFVEHVRPAGILGKVFDLLNPFSFKVTGVNINRDTVGNIKEAGFEIIEEQNLLLGIFKLIIAVRQKSKVPREKSPGVHEEIEVS